MKYNNIQLKITGGMDLEEEPVAGHDIIFSTVLSAYSKEEKDNQDGTFNAVYKAKCCGAVELRQGDKRIKGKDTTNKSKKLRGKIFWEGEGRNIVDHDGFYEAVMQELIVNPKYIDEAISKTDKNKYR